MKNKYIELLEQKGFSGVEINEVTTKVITCKFETLESNSFMLSYCYNDTYKEVYADTHEMCYFKALQNEKLLKE